MLNQLRRVRSSALAKNTFFYAINFGSQILVQLGYFVLISRSLGPAGYGVFASVTAVALFVGVFVGWGSDRLLIQKVTVDHDAFPRQLGHALILNALTVVPLFAATLLAFHYLDTSGLSWTGLFLILLADIVFRKLTMISTFAFMAFDRAATQTCIDIGSQLFRLAAAALAFVLVPDLTLDIWAAFYVAGSALSAAAAFGWMLWKLGRPVWNFERNSLWMGFLFSLEFASVNGVKDLDKPVVVQVLGPELGGIYTAAFRIVDAASAPIRAFLYATYTRYFRAAKGSREASVAFGVRMVPYACLLSAAAALGIIVCAQFVPLVIGPEYESIVTPLRWLAIHPLMLGLMGVGADILRAIDRQGVRVVIMASSTIAIVPFCWIGATYGGLTGAVAARLLVQTSLVAASWLGVRYFRHS
ncbi:lipopolysaccharide biosynthesis protein [Aureimonas pseudogalii]|uniref:O-antigen/teichoic acid export membrane protein n=1 Tax=Aureimonas pseudogalii TaxID=1744844 RepID=A0A7W6EEI6_9HYPH|nr:lipopolysaccharide biosynthesis protein [Aureimonas pseudogalii]MBB3997902.1 O-antigen/teichoic acid export membrane protein [Aureimonas pseudogalii]